MNVLATTACIYISIPPSRSQWLNEPSGSRDPSEVDGVDSSITGVNVQGMVLKNAGKECLRIRYFATNCVVQVNEIGPCGIEDFQQDSDGSNGEGVCEY